MRVFEQRFKIEFGADPEFLEKLERVRALLSGKYHGKFELERLFGILLDEYIERHSPQGRIRRRAERDRKTRLKGKPGYRGSAENAGNVENVTGAGNKNLPASRTGAATETPIHPRSGTKAKTETSMPPRSGAGAGKKGAGVRKKNTAPARTRSACSQRNPRYIPWAARDEVWARDGGRCAFVSPGGRRCGSRWDLEIDHIVPLAKGGGNSPSNLRLLCSRHNLLEAEREFGQAHMARFGGTQERAVAASETDGGFIRGRLPPRR